MLLRSRRTVDFIEARLLSPAKAPPSGPDWLHEIRHDGFRIMARRDVKGVRLITRNGHDFSKRFPHVVAAVAALSARSCLIDGEAIVSNESGLAVFELLRFFRHDRSGVLCAFELLELDGGDLRRLPVEVCKAGLVRLLRSPHPGTRAQRARYQQACKLGCEGIVSKRLGSTYRSGRSPHWVKVKNPKAPAVTREAEEGW